MHVIATHDIAVKCIIIVLELKENTYFSFKSCFSCIFSHTLRVLNIVRWVFRPGVRDADVRVHLFNAAVHVYSPWAVLELMAMVIWKLSRNIPNITFLLCQVKQPFIATTLPIDMAWSLLARSLSSWCLEFLFTPSWWLTCSRVFLILSWQDLMVSTSLIRLFSGLSFTKSIPFLNCIQLYAKTGGS